MNTRHWIVAVATLAMLACGASERANASFIDYTESVTGSGSLGTTNFTNAVITISGTGNTDDLFSPRSGVFSIALTGRVSISGVGNATITDSFVVFVNQTNRIAGFADNTVQRDTLNYTNNAFQIYGLTTAIGPISGPVNFYDQGGQNPVSTTLGSFRISSVSSDATFTATVQPSAVPEPSTLALLGMASLVGLGYSGTRGRRSS